ncbi:MAG TPA: hypothetical protein DEQ61_09730 [Streptomyces sp.]|nr:hypothetical protein [Streptomyces sp.]
MHDTVAPAVWPCELCGKPSRDRVHASCRQYLDDDLAALPQLYRALGAELAPGRRGGDGRSATRSAPLPCSEAVLDLRARGGIEGVVTTWERDARETLGWAPPPFRGDIEQTIAGAVLFLRGNLSWFCDVHEVRELASDVRRLVGECRRIITGERPERRIAVVCDTEDCGGIMRVTISTDGQRCPRCQVQYGRADVLELQPAERRAA